MRHVKLFEDFVKEDYQSVNEFNFNLFGKFKKLLTQKKSDGDEEFLDDISIINPETKKHIKLSSALSYKDDSPVKKLADAAMAELKNNIKDAKHVSVEDKVNFEFAKQLKKRQEQAKEWGEEWTDKDTASVKNEVMVSHWKDMEGDKKQEYLKSILKDSDDDRLEQINKWIDNEGSDVAYNAIDDVDKYLKDESGKGQGVTGIILRSKEATADQRKKALMYDWVANPSSAGSLTLAKHFSEKLKMGEGAKKGLEYRLENGEEFSDKPGGKLRPEVEDANLKAADDIYNKTQEYYKSKGIKTVKVYRGSDDKNPSGYENAIESWTTSKESAEQYGQYVHSKEIPVERILMGHFDKDFPDPYDFNGNLSKEIVILGK